MMTVRGALPGPGKYSSGEILLPRLILADGTRCGLIWGTGGSPVRGVPMNYGCASADGTSQFYAGGLDDSGPRWTIKIAPKCLDQPPYSCPRNGPLFTVDVSRVWR
jgi:hypothetical protein